MTVFLIRNFKDYLIQAVIGLFVILLNIPVCYWILAAQAEVQKRAYIKIHNKTKQDRLLLTHKSSDVEKILGSFDDSETMVYFYYPRYVSEIWNDDSYPAIEPPILIVKDRFTIHKLTLPRIDKGDCVNLYIDKEFQMLNEW